MYSRIHFCSLHAHPSQRKPFELTDGTCAAIKCTTKWIIYRCQIFSEPHRETAFILCSLWTQAWPSSPQPKQKSVLDCDLCYVVDQLYCSSGFLSKQCNFSFCWDCKKCHKWRRSLCWHSDENNDSFFSAAFFFQPKAFGQALLSEVFLRGNLIESDYFGLEFQNMQMNWVRARCFVFCFETDTLNIQDLTYKLTIHFR